MTKNDFNIRLTTQTDYKETENLAREAFWNIYRPGCIEHYVLHCLRNDKDFILELDFVMEKEGKLIGQNVFMPAEIKTDDGRTISVMTMGPISILPELQRQGYGKILLDYSLEKVREFGAGAVCIEGNFDFYSKSGFTVASNYSLRYHGLPEDVDAGFFLCKELIPGYLEGITGEYFTPQCYLVDKNAIDKYDALFPLKEKLKLPGQLFN